MPLFTRLARDPTVQVNQVIQDRPIRKTIPDFLSAARDKARKEGANIPIGWRTIYTAFLGGNHFPQLLDESTPSPDADFGQVMILGYDLCGNVLLCYNKSCPGNEGYDDVACAMVNTISDAIPTVNIPGTNIKLLQPMQTAHMRFHNSVQRTANTTQSPSKSFVYTEFGDYKINMISPGPTDPPNSTNNPDFVPASCEMMLHYLKPVPPPIYSADKPDSNVTCNIQAFWRYCEVHDSVLLYDTQGTYELQFEANSAAAVQFRTHIKTLDRGFGIFVGVRVKSSKWGFVMTWGGPNTFFAPIAPEVLPHFYSTEHPEFFPELRKDFGTLHYGLCLKHHTQYRIGGFYTLTDLALVHARKRTLERSGDEVEEAWFVTVDGSRLDPQFESFPVFFVRICIYDRNQFLLGRVAELPAERRGEIYNGCNMICKRMAYVNPANHIPELTFNISFSKHRLHRIEGAFLPGYAADYTHHILSRIQDNDTFYAGQQQSKAPSQSVPRRTLIQPQVSPSPMAVAPRADPQEADPPTFSSPGLSAPMDASSSNRSQTSFNNQLADLSMVSSPLIEQLPPTLDENTVRASPPLGGNRRKRDRE